MTALADLQCNGFAGVDFNDAAITADALDHALHAMLRTGVTQVFPTLITAHEHDLRERLLALDAAAARARLGTMVAGFHLEGPFLNPGAAGCHPLAAMRDPDTALLDRLCAGLRAPVRMLTLAPELPGAPDLIRRAVASGIVVAIGHTLASAAQIIVAAQAGATLSTHLGNALPNPVDKFENPMMAQLGCDALTATLIADAEHLSPFVVSIFVRAKGQRRIALVTDGTSASASYDGVYTLAGTPIRLDNANVWTPGGTRAGSSLTLDVAVRNVVAWNVTNRNQARRWAGGEAAGLSPHGRVLWSENLFVREATVADVTVVNEQP